MILDLIKYIIFEYLWEIPFSFPIDIANPSNPFNFLINPRSEFPDDLAGESTCIGLAACFKLYINFNEIYIKMFIRVKYLYLNLIQTYNSNSWMCINTCMWIHCSIRWHHMLKNHKSTKKSQPYNLHYSSFNIFKEKEIHGGNFEYL